MLPGPAATLMSGIPSGNRPPGNSCGKVKPYVARCQLTPVGGIRCPFQEALILAWFTIRGVTSQVSPS